MLKEYENNHFSSPEDLLPKKLTIKLIDYFKVFYSWLYAFKRTFNLEPGLYFIGENYNINSPMIVTCNYHMTLYLLWRILRNRNIRILVIDTKGINVWCSSGKGQFCAEEIIKQINRYPKNIISSSESISLILPKLSFSGVSIAKLKKNRIFPKIGPIYAKQLPEYLDDLPLRDRNEDKYEFSMRDRLFTLIPTLVQITKYAIFISIGLFIWHFFFKTNIYWQVIPLLVIITILYIIFFPFLPTKKFTIKGIFLFGTLTIFLSVYYFFFNDNYLDLLSYIFYILFLGGANLFFALSYTGNSGVSNYSLVKKEIIRFLPLTVLLFFGAAITIIIKGVIL